MKNIPIAIICLFMIAGLKAQTQNTSKNLPGNFSAIIDKGEVNLNWNIYNPENLYKFIVESKKSGAENFDKLSEVLFSNFRKKEAQDSAVSYHYLYAYKPEVNGVYFYKLSAVDIANKEIFSEELKVGITEVPEFRLHQNNPNPFNPSTMINYTVLVPTNIKISIYSLTGKFVDILVDGFQSAGNYTVEFNTSKYSDLSSGIYFYKLETYYSSDIRKMIFTK